MGSTISILSLPSVDIVNNKIFGLAEDIQGALKYISSNADDLRISVGSVRLKRNGSSVKQTPEGSSSLKNGEAEKPKLDTTAPSENQNLNDERKLWVDEAAARKNAICSSESISPRPRSELEAAAVKVQKFYRSYRTRRHLADCAVVVEELWWKALDFAILERSSVSFFNGEKSETAISRWARARTRAAKVGKGSSKSKNAQKLALRHWLEAIDPRHRYGHNLHMYYDVWFKSESSQPFFYWLDIGDGKEVNLDRCPRNTLQNQSITYLGPNERKSYEVIVDNGKLVYKQSHILLNTAEGFKWIFVLSTMSALYVGKKKKGKFQHSSFLSGGAITAAGRLVVKQGVLKAIWPYSGHYLPTEEHFKAFINFLEDNNVDLTEVKRGAIDDDECPSFRHLDSEPEKKVQKVEDLSDNEEEEPTKVPVTKGPSKLEINTDEAFSLESGARLSCNWSTGAGPRIGCVRDYPINLQSKALEQVNLSPRSILVTRGNKDPIPSPRPTPRVRLSPRLAYMGIPSLKSPLSDQR